ncbi:hypothetical protein E2C01_034671 [Portunus trituberculatus]|uniref:Uncharacterized protein n=1 Tax=Portunus trituberculatus TaxID=210409 RepID=A0A5B7F781_PORTR|nr:hypothetical protein [Portunus trituberculatus]
MKVMRIYPPVVRNSFSPSSWNKLEHEPRKESHWTKK